MLEICVGHDYSRNEVRGQVHSVLEMMCNTPPSQDASTHHIYDSYLNIIEDMLQTQLFYKRGEVN